MITALQIHKSIIYLVLRELVVKIKDTPVRNSRKGGNRFSGEVEIVAAVSKLPSKRAHGMVTRSMARRLPVVFMALP